MGQQGRRSTSVDARFPSFKGVLALLIGLLLLVPCGKAKTWIWQGALMPTSMRFVVKTDEPHDDFRIVAATRDQRNLSFARRLDQQYSFAGTEPDALFDHTLNETTRELIKFNTSLTRVLHFVLEGLAPNTFYTWSTTGDLHGKFHTPPQASTPFNFSFAFGSCADNDSDHEIFSLIPHNQNPLFMVHMGDLHYGNIGSNEFNSFAMMFDRTLMRRHQAYMMQNLPIVYMWDDHDFGPNNADKFSRARPAAIQAYHTFVPSYSRASTRSDGAVYQSFTIGRILFVVTDTSSERDPKMKTTLGKEQLMWLHDKMALVASKPRELAAMIWVNTFPWIDDHYKWGEFKNERNIISSWIEEFGLKEKLIILSGDAHMLAVDDGTHAAGGVKVFHAAALDAKPTTKGGPYSHGVWPARNQYATMNVIDNGGSVCFLYQGWRWRSTRTLARVTEFHTCDSSKNVAMIYNPSPYFVQKSWKKIKSFLEDLNLPFTRWLVLVVDSSRVTFDDFLVPLASISFFAVLSTMYMIFAKRR